MNGAGVLDFDAVIRTTDFKRQIDEMNARMRSLTSTAATETGKMESQFARLGRLAAGYLTFEGLKDLAIQLVKVRGEFQQLEIAFTTMLRSKSESDKLIGGLIQDAAATPFGLKELAQGAKQLLAYGSNVSNVRNELRTLGDVAAGVSAPVGDLVYLYGTLRTQGRAYAVDIRQFAGRGIPIYAELAKVLGVNVDKVNGLVEAGKVGFPQVEQAFKNMTTGGGLFAGLMEAQSKSLTGLVERFKDAYEVMLNDIGKNSETALGGVINTATALVENYQKVLDIMQIMVVTYGTYKAAVLIASAAQAVAAATTAGWTLAELAHFRALVLVEGAQKLLNRTMLANPYVLAATVLVGLVAAVSTYSRELTAAEKAEASMAAARDKASEAAAGEKAKIDVLIAQINNEKASRQDRNKALQQLIALSPEHLKALTLDSIKTGEGKAAIDAYIASKKKQIELQQIEADLTASIKRQQDAEKGTSDIGVLDRMKTAASAGSLYAPNNQYGKNLQTQTQSVRDKQIADEKAIQERLKGRVSALQDADKATADSAKTAQKATARTVDYYEEEIKTLRKKQGETATTRAQYLAYQKQIDTLDKARRRLTGEQTSAEKKAAKDADKMGAFGSVEYWDTIAQKAAEIISKTDVKDTGTIARQKAIQVDAERKAEEARKITAIKSFEEEVEAKKKAYVLYEQWASAYGKQAADAQFGELIQSGQTYVDYLNNQIAILEADRENVGLTDKQAGNLSGLLSQRDEATGKKKAIDSFTESLAKARTETVGLTEYLALLKAQQDALAGNNTDFGIAARKEVAEQIIQTEAARKAELDSFLANVVGSEQQRLQITRKYADLRAEVEKNASGLSDNARQARLNQINDAERVEVNAVNQGVAESSKAFKDLSKVIDAEGRKVLEIRKARLVAYLAVVKGTVGQESEEYKRVAREIKETDFQLDKDTLDSYRVFASLVGEAGEALSEVGGGIGSYGRLLAGAASQANLVAVSFDKTASETERIQAGVSGVIGLVDILISSANQRREAETAYYRAINAQQQEYNLALNQQLGLQTQLSENVFVKDFAGRIRDGVAQMTSAQKSYNDAIKKLSEGQAKTGQRNAVDWSKVGKGAGAGASVGAAIGSVVPVIGTAIGAAVGGIVGGVIGLFGGKKKEDQFGSLLGEYPELIQKGKDGQIELNAELAKTLISQNLVDESTKQLLTDAVAWTEQIKKAREQIKGVISELAGSLGNTLRDSLVGAFKDGSDAAVAFRDSVSGVLEDILSQMIFQQVFAEQFDKLQADMEASFGAGGDGSWVDDFGNFFGKADELTKLFNDGLASAQGAAAQYGLNVFTPTANKDSAKTNSLSGAIKGVTEETAGLLAGQMNAIRIQQAETGAVIRSQLITLSQIEVNTRRLESIDKNMQTLADNSKKDSLRDKGW